MDVREKYQLWDSFLERWPRETLKQMTLEQYVSVDDNDTFTYWLETKTRKLGSIQGNTSAKFGIYKRKKEEANTQNGIKNGAVYSWWQFLGETEEEVFTKVKAIILEIVDAVQQGDMESIEKIYFSSMVKWKIAFLYQNRQNPCLINTSSKSMLQVLVDEKVDQSYTELYQTLIKEKGNQDLLAFGEKCWKTANAKKQNIENKKLLTHFRHIEQFEKHFRSWSDELVQEFCNLIREANKQKLDVYTTKMNSGSVIRLGRKELNTDKAISAFAGITLQENQIICRYSDQDFLINEELIQSIKTSKILNKYAEEYPITRKVYLPKDYLAFDVIENDENDEEFSAESEVNDMMNKVIPLNQILYGPPGTGKTYQLLNRFAQYTTNAQVQSRPVWLAEKLEPLNWMQILALCLLDLGHDAKVGEIVQHEYYSIKAGLNGRVSNLAQTAWSYLQTYTIPDSETVKFSSRREPAIFNKTTKSYWYLVEENLDLIEDLVELHKELVAGPQSAQTIKRYSCVTFHQSYGYEEFIEGLKAKTNDEDAITYVVEPGEFVKLCRRAEQDPENRYAIFIDEINRGNVSKIFGELITLIEPDKRAGEKNQVAIQLAYSGAAFSVPKNVDIIGTMNTADRSLTMLDTALRRRFDFVEMMPDPDVLGETTVKGIHLATLLKTLNERIDVLFDREHTLGHAFLIPVKLIKESHGDDEAFDNLIGVFQNKIIPLLQEYFFEDWQKIRLVLGDNQKPADLQFVTEEKLSSKKLDDLFGNGHGLNQYGDEQSRYSLQLFSELVWQEPNAYLGIYSKVVSQKAETEMTQVSDGVNPA